MAPETPAQPPAPPKRTWRKFLFLLPAVILVGIAMVLLFPEQPSGDLVLLGPGDFTNATKPSVLTLMKYKLIRVAGPLINRFRKAKRQIILRASFIAVPASESLMDGFASLARTNNAGVSVWVLSDTETRALQRQLQTNTSANLVNQASIVTYDGGQAAINNGVNLRAGTSLAWAGMQLEVLPKISSHSIRVLMHATWSEEAVPGGGPQAVRTNFSAGCSALLANNSGLIFLGKNKGQVGGTNLLLILSTIAVDATGKPLKL
jgi:hypothetical protein